MMVHLIDIRKFLVSLFCVMSVMTYSTGVVAHHSVAYLDQTREIQMQGVITKYDYVNPHVLISFEVVNENGEKEVWDAGSNSINNLRRAGIFPDSLKIGESVLIAGLPPKDPNLKTMRINKITFDDGRVMLLYGNNVGIYPPGQVPAK